jgi:glycosyltransferase involved in cell wall biosynthesis
MKFLFLYTEIAEYFLACCTELKKYGEVHIVRWEVNKEAPFQFQFSDNIKIYNKENYNIKELNELVKTIDPSVIICSGWIDKTYLKITKTYYEKIPTVMTCDTYWTGSLKQQLATVLSKFTLLKIFSHAWVPGQSQKQYVQKLGFKNENILTGFYSCDLIHFESIYQAQYQQKQKQFPKRFLYVGRYVEFKGIKELWQAFTELQVEQSNDWELWCLGVGDIPPINHTKIKHFGFIQPSDLAKYTEQTGVFVLPSRFEPWGVVVHEYAASGFPLLLSNKVGAKEQFLQEGKNGFEFEAENVESIKLALQKIIALKDSELFAMGATSNELSKSISPKTWADSLLKIV